MISGIYDCAAGAFTQSTRADMIANNLANISTPGFMRDEITFRSRLAEAIEDGPYAYHNRVLDQMGGGLFIDRTYFQNVPGPISYTKRPLDLALTGDGFFEVTDGVRSYFTRAGDFTVSPDGRLVTSDMKYAVVNAEGGTFTITDPAAVTVDPTGVISERGEVIGRLSIVSFANPMARLGLRKIGNKVLQDLGQAGRQASQAGVQQGALEGSNVNPVVELSKMITALRSYEANIQMIRSHDSLLDRIVNEVARPVQR